MSNRRAHAILLSIGALIVGCLVGCDARSDGAPVVRVGGCYDVLAGEWAPASPEAAAQRTPEFGADSVLFALPVRVRLDSGRSRFPGGSDRRLLSIPEDVLQLPHPFLVWRVHGDSLELGTSTGFVGTVVQLTAEDDAAWVGQARTFEDSGYGTVFRREVRLEPVSCNSPPPVPATADLPLLRRIELASGDFLTLRQRLPPGLRTSVTEDGIQVLADAASPWAGTDSILVSLDRQDSTLTQIVLSYPDAGALRRFADHLEAEYGPPDFGLAWMNRTTEILLREGGDGLRMQVADPRRAWPSPGPEDSETSTRETPACPAPCRTRR